MGDIKMNIVLHEPEIPQNTGNISRTCAVTHSTLHLIKPLGFSVDDKYLKRSGLDYWQYLDVRYYENFEDFIEKNPGAKIYMATTKAKKIYTGRQLFRERLYNVWKGERRNTGGNTA